MGECVVTINTLDLVLSFRRAISFEHFKITALQGKPPDWKLTIMTPTDAIISFDYYPENAVLEIEAVD
jgi:hypothetical protein